MPNGNLVLVDTSVYIENFRTGRFTHALVRSPWIIRCSAVVLHELRRGAKREAGLTPEEGQYNLKVGLGEKLWRSVSESMMRQLK